VPSKAPSAFLVLRAGVHRAAFPVADVVETLRTRLTVPLTGAPPFVDGLTRIRGLPVPVVDLLHLMAGTPGAGTRLVTLRAGPRVVAVRVDDVEGLARLESDAALALPPLASTARNDLVETVARLDGDLLLVLRAARLLAPGDLPSPGGEGAP
jgi:purine-binding chemotaxis protein CheW